MDSSISANNEQQRLNLYNDSDDVDSIISRESLKSCSSTVSNGQQFEQPVPNIRVRDMIRQYDSAVMPEPSKQSQVSMASSKSSYCGLNRVCKGRKLNHFTDKMETKRTEESQMLSNGDRRSVRSQNSEKKIRTINSPHAELRAESRSELQAESRAMPLPLKNQNSLFNFSRNPIELDISKKSASPREKKRRHSITATTMPIDVEEEPKTYPLESSYQSKTTIAKTSSGVRIIIDIFFEQNKSVEMEDVVGSRVETDIPPSKILSEFQQRVMASSRN